MEPADELRQVLVEIGRGDLTVRPFLGTMLYVETPGPSSRRVAFVQQLDDWGAFGRATAKGGWAVHAHGASIGEAIRALRAHGPDVFDPPRDPFADLPNDVLRALDTIATEGKVDVLGDQTAIRWTTVFAHDEWKTVHRAFDTMAGVLEKKLGASRATTTKRKNGPKLQGRVWAKIALFESDHDPGAGALVQLAVWERGEPTELPPW